MLAIAVTGSAGSGLSYLATSYQGSVVEALDSTGAVGVTASQLYAPYGGVRYASGALPTDYGYTGQRRDASSGLDYYGARYYDPVVGQFTSADTLLAGGLNRYGYVGGNPTTATDPSGHMLCSDVASTSCQGVPPPRPGYRVRYPVIKIKCLIRCDQSPENGGAGTPNASYGSGNGGRGAPISVNAEHDVLWFDGLWFGGYGAYVGATRGYYKSLAKSLSQDAWDTYSYINKRGSPVDVDFKSGTTVGTPDEIQTAERLSNRAGRFGKLLAGAGFALDWAFSGLDYYYAHQSDPNAAAKAVAYGALHATIVTGTSIAFADIGEGLGELAGGALGTLIPIPIIGTIGGAALGAAVGAAVGGLAGGIVGGWIADNALPIFFG